MGATIVKDTQVLFLAEAPGKDEDENTGRPLTGPSGKLLRECLPDGWKNLCSFDNVVNCRPEGNRTPIFTEIECCRPRRIKVIEECKPKLIVGLGAIPLNWALGSTDMAGMRGRFFAVKIGNHECWYLPTYHPSFILRVARDKRKPLNSMMGHCFRADIQRALSAVSTLKPPHVDTEAEVKSNIQCFDGSDPKHFDALCKLLDEAKKAPLKAVDIETRFLRPYTAGAGLMSVAISYDLTNFAFSVDHPQSKWTKTQRDWILDKLLFLLVDDTIKIAHNAPFELEWFAHFFGKEAVNHAAWECTMMQAHFLDERKGARRDDDSGANRYISLDFLCKMHFGIAYKALFPLNKKDMAKSNLADVLTYNGVDTKYTLRLFKRQIQLLKKSKLLNAYYEALPRQAAVALMQFMGVTVDQKAVKAAQAKLNPEIERIEREVQDLKVVKAFVADKKSFNPYSGPDVISIFRDYLKRPEIVVKSDRGEADRVSTDKGVLDQIDHPLAQMIVELRNKSKMASTYVDGLELNPPKRTDGKKDAVQVVFPDGCLHTSFNTTITETGRLSCVAHWTPILTRSGWKPISEIRVGDDVWTHKERWMPVTALWRKGWEQMFTLHLSNGELLTCTKSHRLLLDTNCWATVEEICGLFRKVGFKPFQYRRHTGFVQEQRVNLNCGDIRDPKYKGSQHLSSGKNQPLQRGEEGISLCEILGIKNGQQKPDVGKDWRKAPQLEGGMLGQQRVLYHKGKWEENIRASSHYAPSSWDNLHPTRDGGASHRWGSIQQQARQSSSNYWGWAQANSCQTEGFEVVSIEKIEISGSFEVFDVTVLNDASYLSCGIFSHNSSDPNLQNWPKRKDSWLRSTVIPPKGHLFVAADYGQLEACTGAMCSKDKFLVKSLWEDYDIHQEWALRIGHDCPALIGGKANLSDKAAVGKFRSLVKNKLVFPAFFGASNESVKNYLAGACDYDLDQSLVDTWMESFWESFGGVAKWQKATMHKYYDVGYVETLQGRRRHYPLTKNQAINQPVQGTAAELVCDAMNRLSYLAASTEQWHLHPVLNVHDDLSFFIPEDTKVFDESIEAIVREMLTFDFPWINVPLAVEVSVGKNWADVQPVGKFWSHKDL